MANPQHRFEKKDIHPFRYRTSRRYIPGLLNAFDRIHDKNIPSAGITMDTLTELQQRIIAIYNQEVIRIPYGQRPPNPGRVISGELSMFVHYAEFVRRGQNIFRPTSYLIELLKHTDISDVILNQVKLPFTAFYLSFGNQSQWYLLTENNIIDGAYISTILTEDKNVMQVILTTKQTQERKKNFILDPPIYYYFSLEYDNKTDKPIKTLLKESLEKEFTDLSAGSFDLEKLNTPEISKEDITVESFSPFYTSAAELNDDGSITISKTDTPTSEMIRRRFVRENFDTFCQAFKLIINLLCYIGAEPEDAAEVYPSDAPKDKVELFEKATRTGNTKRITQTLSDLGYTRIRLIGKKLDSDAADNYSALASATAKGGEKSTHWRRGHWRSQRVGPKLSLSQLIFIKPTLIRGDKGTPIRPHIYSVSE